MKFLFFSLFFSCFAGFFGGVASQQNALAPNDDCQDLNMKSYEKCQKKTKCSLCALTVFCGWCVKTKTCMPINALEKKALCGENCEEILGLEQCYKGLTKKYVEEIDLENNYFDKPQFKPGFFEVGHYFQKEVSEEPDKNIENEENNENETLAKGKYPEVSLKNIKKDPIRAAKRKILGFFDKLLERKA